MGGSSRGNSLGKAGETIYDRATWSESSGKFTVKVALSVSPTMDRGNAEKKQEAISPGAIAKKKKTRGRKRKGKQKYTEIYASGTESPGKLARGDREIEFPEEILLPSVSLSRAHPHLFISREGCASTYAIEMKFLINK